MRKILFLIFCFVFLMSGCGSPGGGAESFKTVMVTVHIGVANIDSDLVTWKLSEPCDPNCNLPVCDVREYFPDYVKVTIKSKIFPIIELEEPSAVRIENVRIDYVPADGVTPSLDLRYEARGQVVDPNDVVDINVKIVSQHQKMGFFNDPNDYLALITNNSHYIYHVNLTFGVVEIITDQKGEVSTGLTIDLADFLCDDEQNKDLDCDDECRKE